MRDLLFTWGLKAFVLCCQNGFELGRPVLNSVCRSRFPHQSYFTNSCCSRGWSQRLIVFHSLIVFAANLFLDPFGNKDLQ
jgi:hypothetical protein